MRPSGIALGLAALVITPSCAILVLGEERTVGSIESGPGGGGASSSSAAVSSTASSGGAGGGDGPTSCDGQRVVWVRQIGDGSGQEPWSIDADLEGGVFVAGEFEGKIDLGGKILQSQGEFDMFLARFDEGGNSLWGLRFGNVGNDWGKTRVKATPDGGVLFSGSFAGTIDFGGGERTAKGSADAFVASFDAHGAYRWDWTSSSTGDTTVRQVGALDSGSFLVTGSFAGQTDFGGGPLGSAGGHDIFLLELDAEGSYVGAQRFGGTGEDTAEWITVDSKGVAMIGGASTAHLDFGSGALVNSGGGDAYVSVYDASGNPAWSRMWGDGQAQGVVRLATRPTNDDFLICGTINGTMNLGGGQISNLGDGLFFAWFTEGGDYLRSKAFPNLGFSFGIASDDQGNTVVAGWFKKALGLGTSVTSTNDDDDVFVAKLDTELEPMWAMAFGGIKKDNASGVAMGTDGSVFVVGAFQESVTIEGCPPLTSEGGRDIFLMKLKP